MKSNIRPAIVMAAFALFIFGCSGEYDAASKGHEKSEEVSVGSYERSAMEKVSRDREVKDDGWGYLSTNERLPGVISVEYSDSWETRLNSFSREDQSYLKSINERYFGALEFSSANEQLEQIKNGYPTPEEWLAARQMTDQEIEAAADDGNTKAQMMYADRLAARAHTLRSVEGDDHAINKDYLRARVDAAKYSSLALRSSKSPFAAYLYGEVSRLMTGTPEMAAAGILLAREMGDVRADTYALNLSRLYPGMNTATVQVAYGTMRQIAML